MSGPQRKILGLFCAGLLVLAALSSYYYWQFMSWADAPIGAESATPFQLHLLPGQSLSSLAAELDVRGFLAKSRWLVMLGKLTGAETRLQAGEYALNRQSSPRQVLEQLTQGQVITYAFRIQEGATVREMLQSLAADPRLKHELLATDAQALLTELDLQTDFAEGMFFPDTYQFRRGDSDRVLLMRAHEVMVREIDAAWRSRAVGLVLSQPAQLVILASIIEKETSLEADRAQISQVFHARLQARMLLQTDPTVIYALGQSFDGNLTRAHLRVDSPYNTYRVRGLPPTPIALPSVLSLHAAAQPATGDFLYFVARGDGSSQFSRTLAEHNQAVRRYQINVPRGS